MSDFPDLSALSAKDRLILERLGEGKRSPAICKETGITLKSFYTYCDRIRQKLDANSTVDAVMIYHRLKREAEARRLAAASEGALNP